MKFCELCGKSISFTDATRYAGLCEQCWMDEAERQPAIEAQSEETMDELSGRLRKEQEAFLGACPDCGASPLIPIGLFARGPQNPLSSAAIDSDVGYYTDQNLPRGFWLGMRTETGTVHAGLCPSCRRIILRGKPNDN